MKIAHIINPVNVTESSDLFIAQPITFETMRRAKKYAKNSGLDVELFYTCYEEDLSISPEGFTQTKLLEKSILDYKNFEKKRKLPLIKDILDRLYESSDADYFIYTNVDIAVQENFYIEVKNIIDQGYDAFVINRRTIDKKYTSIAEIPEMYQDKGEKHPGYDCFVFKRDVYTNYELGTACIGANWIGRVVISNVIAHSNKFKIFENEYLTFHIGDDRSWNIYENNLYDKNNENIVVKVLGNLVHNPKFNKKPLLLDFYNFHIHRTGEQIVPDDIISANSPKRNYNYDLGKLFGSEIKGSTEWKKPILLRQDPIFIVGFPRSGTTLLQALIATQSNIISLPETHFFTRVRNKLNVINGIIQPNCFESVVYTIRERISFSEDAYNHLKNLVDNEKLTPKMLFEVILVDNFIVDYNIEDLSSRIWMEKTPDHVMAIDVIHRFYPKAKFIYVIRNPEKAILSRRKYFKLSHEDKWSVEKHAKLWKRNVLKAEEFGKEHPNLIKIVKLEDVTKDKEKELEKICQFLNIDFDISLIENHKNISNKFILPWEHWKQDVSKEISPTISNKNDNKFNFFERIRLKLQAWRLMSRYGY
jgi:hypothetical protein